MWHAGFQETIHRLDKRVWIGNDPCAHILQPLANLGNCNQGICRHLVLLVTGYLYIRTLHFIRANFLHHLHELRLAHLHSQLLIQHNS